MQGTVGEKGGKREITNESASLWAIIIIIILLFQYVIAHMSQPLK